MASRGVEAGRAFMRLSIDNKAFRRGLDNASKRLKAFGLGVTRVGGALVGFGAGLLAPLGLAIRQASDAQETFSKFDTVFGDQAKAAREWGDALAGQVGRSKTEVAGFLSGFQDLLVPIGIDPTAAEASSKALTQLAIDLASFNNKADSATVIDLQAALTGSSEVMKKYGVIVNEAAVKQQLLNEGIQPKNATEQEKVFARLAIIFRDTSVAQGDAIRTADGFANSTKGLLGAITDLGASIGRALLEPLATLASRVKTGVRALEEFASKNAGLIRIYSAGAVGVLALGGALTALGITIGLTGVAISGAVAIAGVFSTAVAAVVSPVGLAVVAVGGLGSALVRYTSIGARAIVFLRNQFGPLFDTVRTTVDAVRDYLAGGQLEAAGRVALAGLRVAFLEVSAQIQTVWAGVQTTLTKAWFTTIAGLVVGASRFGQAWAQASYYVQSRWAEAQAAVTRGVLRSQKFIIEKLTGKTFDISVELDQADASLKKTLADIDASKRKTITQLREDEAATLTAIDEQQKQRQGEINAQLIAARDAAGKAKDELTAMASKARDAAKAFVKTANDLGIAGEQAADQARRAAQKTDGTFSSSAAALILGSSGVQLGIAKQQLAQAVQTNKILRRGGGLAFA